MEKHLPNVPGFFVQEGNAKKYWTLAGSSGLLIPVRDEEKPIVGLLVRPEASNGGKYLWLTSKSKNRGGPGPGAPVHVPLFDGDTSVIRIREGALKADVATSLSGILTVGLLGVGSWKRAAPLLKKIGVKTVRVAYNADCRTNLAVAGHLQRLMQDLRDKDFAAELASHFVDEWRRREW